MSSKANLFSWMAGTVLADEAHGVRFIDALARVATTPLGKRVEDREAGLCLEAVTLPDLQMAVSCLVCIAFIPLYRDHPAAERARMLVQTKSLWKAAASVDLDMPP